MALCSAVGCACAPLALLPMLRLATSKWITGPLCAPLHPLYTPSTPPLHLPLPPNWLRVRPLGAAADAPAGDVQVDHRAIVRPSTPPLHPPSTPPATPSLHNSDAATEIDCHRGTFAVCTP
eukprot:990078-Prorocentrum_minimum.AAC.1